MVVKAGVFLALITLFTTFRVWAICRRRKFGWHDAFAICSYLSAVSLFIVEILMYSWNFGIPESKIVPGSAQFAQILFAYGTSYSFTNFFAMASFITFFLTIFDSKNCRRILIVLFVFEVANVLWQFLIPIFQCDPPRRSFDPTVPGKCIDLGPVFITGICANLVVLIAMFTIPIVKLRKFNMPVGKKLGVIFMMGCFLVIVIVDAIGLYSIINQIYGCSKFSPFFETTSSNVEAMTCILYLSVPSIYHVICRQSPRLTRLLRLGDAYNDSDPEAPADPSDEKPATIGQCRNNKIPRNPDHSLFSDGSLFSSLRTRSRAAASRNYPTVVERPSGPVDHAKIQQTIDIERVSGPIESFSAPL